MEKCFCLHEATQKFATVQIKNMATVGGNICRSSPGADTVPPLMAYDTQVKVIGANGEREILLADFFTGPGSNVLNREIVKEIIIPFNGNNDESAFEKVMRNSGDLAKMNCAVRIKFSDGKFRNTRIVLGAVGPTPIRAINVEQALLDKNVSSDVIQKAIEKLAEDISPITDVRSTKEYRIGVSKVIVRRLIEKCLNKL
jgi:carbon-monoxide dehydrogenase medium subunit